MHFRLCLILLPLFIGIVSLSQAQSVKLSGKILNAKNEALAGVSVKIVGAQGGTITDIEGRFILNLSIGKKYELEFSTIGYATKTISDVEVAPGQANELNIVLDVQAKTGENVVITTSRSSFRRETINSAVSFQKNTNTVAQIVSAETIRRSPDKNTGEVLKRLPGLSIQDGRYVIVRGLSDRYNQAMLNGILLSSTEPDRKTFSFDIFPSAIIDNIVINKAFVPEYPGEWAGGLIQVNTKDIPTQNFFNVQVGTGINTNVIGNKFYKYHGSNLDFLGFDNGVRALPDNFPTKSEFANMSRDERAQLGGETFSRNWGVHAISPGPNEQFQIAGGFNANVFHKKFGGTIALTYNRSMKHYEFENSFFTVTGNQASPDFIYSTDKYAEEVLWGGIANFSLQLNNNNKISVKNLFNINTSNYTSVRTGYEYISVNDSIRGKELAMRSNIFYNTQIAGEHSIPSLKVKLNWYGGFNILNQYIPGQRRSDYLLNDLTNQYEARISTGQSQKGGSIFYGNLSDYIYTAGGDVTKNFTLFDQKQSVKGGYLFQVKDRLYDARPFYVQLFDNNIKTLPEEQLFAPENFTSGKLGLDQFGDFRYRYMANSILNAGYLQFDNSFTNKLRAVWGLRIEDFDQLIGSVKQSDPRHRHTEVRDYLPAVNLTYKLNQKTNLRLAASQTVVRPEFRELTEATFFDFELGASVEGNPVLERTKITNADLRYEIYPRPGELFTFGIFYKYFQKPIEQTFNQSGAGASNTFLFVNADNATSYGAEFEMRKKLDFSDGLKNFTLSSNVAYIYNRVKFASDILNRPMQGQSPFLVNAGLQYDLEKAGLNSTLLFNEIGRRILYTGNDQVPAIWEGSRPLLDFQFAKKIIKNKGELKLNVSDILNRTAKFYHDLNDDGRYTKSNDAIAISRKYGTTFTVTFGYTFK